MKYKATPTQKKPRKKPRYPNQFWFNPPWNQKVKTNIAKEFLKILDKNFPKGTKWEKFFNRHTTRVSYSCTRNIGAQIRAHNQSVTKTDKEQMPGCNCRTDSCPLDDKNCQTKGAVYTGTLESKKDNGRTDNYTYIGSTATTFKERWYNHKYDLTHDTGAGTRLSGKYWELINANPNDHTPTISWKIVNKCHPLKAGCKVCDVCTTEKTRILLQHNVPEPKPPKNTIFLNQRTELFAKCRHRRKYLLIHCDDLYK